LPEREEDDRFDGEEFQNRIKRSQKIFCGHVEEVERIKSQGNGDVVNARDVNVALASAVS